MNMEATNCRLFCFLFFKDDVNSFFTFNVFNCSGKKSEKEIEGKDLFGEPGSFGCI